MFTWGLPHSLLAWVLGRSQAGSVWQGDSLPPLTSVPTTVKSQARQPCVATFGFNCLDAGVKGAPLAMWTQPGPSPRCYPASKLLGGPCSCGGEGGALFPPFLLQPLLTVTNWWGGKTGMGGRVAPAASWDACGSVLCLLALVSGGRHRVPPPLYWIANVCLGHSCSNL